MAKEKNSKNENKRSFMKDFKAELKKVVWPTSKQMVNNVVAVITIVLITAAIVFVLDFAFNAMNKYGIDKIKEKVQASNKTQVVENIEENAADESENVNDNAEKDVEVKTTENNENAEVVKNNVEAGN